MAKKENPNEIKYISLNTALIIGLVCLIAGFLGGVVYSTYKAGPGTSVQQGSFPPQVSSGPKTTPQQTSQILTLEESVSDNPKDFESWVKLGNLYFDTDNYQRAINAYNRYLELKPDNPNVWTDLGVMYRRSGQPADAVAAFDRAISLDPKHETALFNKGIVLLHDLGNREAAVKAWEKLAEINPSFKSPGGQSILDLIKNE
jgi:cytochrome c-type biogenesis protein CcmH/NrfG